MVTKLQVMRGFLFVLTTMLVGSLAARGQVLPLADGLLAIETNAPGAIVMVGSEAIGTAANSPFLISVGPKQITLVEATVDGWEPRRAMGSAVIRPNETTSLRIDLPIRYRIDSMPPDVEVALRADGGEEEELGVAPFTVDRPEVMRGMLVGRRPGFMPAEMTPGDSLVNRHTLILNPMQVGSELDGVATWIPPHEPRRWIDYAAAGVALAAASVAIYYKFEADAVDDRYRSPDSLERGDPLLKDEAERLDLYSLGALGVMQAGITVLTIRFILR